MNLARRIEQYLPRQVAELVRATSREADSLGQKVYLVGGAVRDLLLGEPSLCSGLRFDVDLVVEGDAITLAHQVAETTEAKVLTHPRFGTAKLSYGNFTLDMATARHEIYAKPGALPEVTPGAIQEDLSRRDFSINAMAISLAPGNYGELLDPYRGKSDLEHCLVRILHSESFRDDATRILRAIRYEQRLGFKLESQTAQLLKRHIPMLETISGDRIRHELELILKEKYPENVIRRFGELGVLRKIKLPLQGDGWIAEKFEKARQLSKPGQLSSLYFCLLGYQLSEKESEEFVLYLNMSKKLAKQLRHTLCLKAQLPLLDKPLMKHSEIYYLLHEYDPLAIQANAIASESLTACRNLELFLSKLRYVKVLLRGEELQKLGIPAGPELGEVLEILHKAKLDGEIKTKAEEEKLALSAKTRAKGRRFRDQNSKAGCI